MKTTRAVILAGGRGERMRPITDITPKALVPINGIPILSHQLLQLERLGFDEVIILTGYLSSSIDKFCSSQTTSLKLKCVPSNPLDSPADRLLNSREIIGDNFLLIYCDNLVLSDIEIQELLTKTEVMTFLIESRTAGNIEIRNNGTATYHIGQRTPIFGFVEMGNINIRSKNFFDSLEQCKDLPTALANVSSQFECSFVKLSNPALSISNIERFLEIQRDRRIVILDRDGVLIEKMERRKYLTNIQDYQPIIKNWNGLLELSEVGVDFLVATNQPGIALGHVDEQFLIEFHQLLTAELLAFGIRLLAVYVCPHHWELNCDCRKPQPGMLLQAIDQFQLKSKTTIYIGDDNRDLAAATAAGIPGLLLGHEHSESYSFPDLSAAISRVKEMLLLVE
jgi:histidinol-phosphate phosphatase family protein